MIETCGLKNVVIFFQTILSFVLSRKIWNKIKYLIKENDDDPNHYGVNYMKIRITSAIDLPSNRLLLLTGMVILIRPVFFEEKSDLFENSS